EPKEFHSERERQFLAHISIDAPLEIVLRGCASRWSWAAGWAAVPAVVGPGAADQPAAHEDGVGQGQPERHDQPTPLGAPAQLAVLVGPSGGALDPPAAGRRGSH